MQDATRDSKPGVGARDITARVLAAQRQALATPAPIPLTQVAPGEYKDTHAPQP